MNESKAMNQRIHLLEPKIEHKLTAYAILGVYESLLYRHKYGQDIAINIGKCLISDLLIMSTRGIYTHTIIMRSEFLYIAVDTCDRNTAFG